MRELLERGANPNIPNKQGLTPLHQAAYWGEVGIVGLLLRSGADPKIDNSKGWTPLHSASLAGGLCGRDKIVDMLLKAGADPMRKDKYGWVAKDYAELWKKEDPSLSRLMRSYEGNQTVQPTPAQVSAPALPAVEAIKMPPVRKATWQRLTLTEKTRAVFVLPPRPVFLSSRRVAGYFHFNKG